MRAQAIRVLQERHSKQKEQKRQRLGGRSRPGKSEGRAEDPVAAESGQGGGLDPARPVDDPRDSVLR